jgi:hypothetical protein
LKGRSRDRHIRVVLVQTQTGYRFTAVGNRVDLLALDTGIRDLNVAFEIGPLTFAQNRNLSGKKNVFKLPRRRV